MSLTECDNCGEPIDRGDEEDDDDFCPECGIHYCAACTPGKNCLCEACAEQREKDTP